MAIEWVEATYRVKESGRDGSAFFQPAMNIDAVSRSATKQAIFEGLEKNQFELRYQPIVDLQTGQIATAETLLRWHHPQQGEVMPSDFIQIAEDTVQIIAIGKWVIEQAAKQLHNWQSLVSTDFRLAINISARQLHDESLLETLSRLPDILVTKLDFEITETAFLDKHHNVMDYLDLIRKKGGKISLDDFGMGYSSLHLLLKFLVDTIKIERTFLAHDLSQERHAALVDAIFSLARSVGAHVVAEGVETTDQIDFLIARNCARAQGFIYSKPLTAGDFGSLYYANKAKRLALNPGHSS